MVLLLKFMLSSKTDVVPKSIPKIFVFIFRQRPRFLLWILLRTGHKLKFQLPMVTKPYRSLFQTKHISPCMDLNLQPQDNGASTLPLFYIAVLNRLNFENIDHFYHNGWNKKVIIFGNAPLYHDALCKCSM